MANVMVTKWSIWTYNERETKWYGKCIECKGEKAKYTPQELVMEKIKPCPTCTNIQLYEDTVKRNSPSKEGKQ